MLVDLSKVNNLITQIMNLFQVLPYVLAVVFVLFVYWVATMSSDEDSNLDESTRIFLTQTKRQSLKGVDSHEEDKEIGAVKGSKMKLETASWIVEHMNRKNIFNPELIQTTVYKIKQLPRQQTQDAEDGSQHYSANIQGQNNLSSRALEDSKLELYQLQTKDKKYQIKDKEVDFAINGKFNDESLFALFKESIESPFPSKIKQYFNAEVMRVAESKRAKDMAHDNQNQTQKQTLATEPAINFQTAHQDPNTCAHLTKIDQLIEKQNQLQQQLQQAHSHNASLLQTISISNNKMKNELSQLQQIIITSYQTQKQLRQQIRSLRRMLLNQTPN